MYPKPQLNTELKENLKDTMAKRYHQPGHQAVTSAVDQLQQEVGGWVVLGGCMHPQGLPGPVQEPLVPGLTLSLVLDAVPLLWQQQLTGLAGQ